MNILTDILNLFKRHQVVTSATPDDLIVLGRHEEPDMYGIASPIPYKSVKLIKVQDLITTASSNTFTNVNNATGTNPVGVYKNVTGSTVNLRSICGIGNNITVAQNLNEIEISTDGEPNTGSNLGTGAEVFSTKVGEDLQFRTLTSKDGSVTITQSSDEIDFAVVVSGGSDTNTTYDLEGLANISTGIDIRLVGSDSTVDIVTLNPGANIAISDLGGGVFEIEASNQTVNLTGSGGIGIGGSHPNFIIDGSALQYTAGAGLTLSSSEFSITDVTRSDTTSAASPAHTGTFTVIDDVTTNAKGQITAVNVKTVTLPSSGTGADGVITNVALSGTDLQFTGSNGGFNGTVDLGSLQDGNATYTLGLVASGSNDTVIKLTGAGGGANSQFTLAGGTGITVTENLGTNTIVVASTQTIDYITDIQLSGTDLQVQATGNAFQGAIDLSSIADVPVALTGSGGITITGTYPSFNIDGASAGGQTYSLANATSGAGYPGFSLLDSTPAVSGHSYFFGPGTGLNLNATNVGVGDTLFTYTLANVSRTDTTSIDSPAHGAYFTVIDALTTNTTGQVTAANLKTVYLPNGVNEDWVYYGGSGGSGPTIPEGDPLQDQSGLDLEVQITVNPGFTKTVITFEGMLWNSSDPANNGGITLQRNINGVSWTNVRKTNVPPTNVIGDHVRTFVTVDEHGANPGDVITYRFINSTFADGWGTVNTEVLRQIFGMSGDSFGVKEV